ncbi:MAG: hypothetical protein MHM6MM_005247 [Cercozoa sp. M6MM]
MSESEQWQHRQSVRIQFPSSRVAKIVTTAVQADAELRPDRCRRHLELASDTLIASFESQEVRFLRVSVNAFLSNVKHALQMIAAFHDSMQPESSTP